MNERKTHKAGNLRQGRIVLNTPARRAIFFGGLMALVAAAVALALLA